MYKFFSHIYQNGKQFISLILSKNTKKSYKKELVKGIKILFKKKKKKNSGIMAANNRKTFLNMKKKDWLSIEKNILKKGKTLCNNFQAI